MTEITDPTTRRAVLGGVAAVGAGAVLAACGGDSGPKSSSSSDGGSSSSSGSGDTASGGAIGTTADVPVGGGTVFQKQKIVVTQPKKGDFKAFTAVCTHMGCTVGEVNGDTIQCNCHGSQYSAEDGSVKKGPAPKPLAEKKVTLKGDEIIVS
jgi:Rieske Fe-S protein